MVDTNAKDCGRWLNLDAAMNAVTVDGEWLEFGVWKGSSLTYIAAKARTKLVHGFDSFRGLPKDDGTWGKGMFLMTQEEIDSLALPPNAVLHVGLFAETIPKFRFCMTKPVAFLHIDADIYSSAVEVLQGFRDSIVKGTVIVFDEFDMGESQAFEEFLSQTGRHAAFISRALMQMTAVMED
jgi:hypothetical protein